MKFQLASLKSLTNCENPLINPHQRACSSFPIAACDSKSCLKAVCDLRIVSKADHECTLEATNESEGKLEQIFDEAFRTSVFKEETRNFIYNFILNKAG
jgi:hypothetical protein